MPGTIITKNWVTKKTGVDDFLVDTVIENLYSTNMMNGEQTMKGWDVFMGSKLIDTVYFTASCDEDYVRRSLIDHDGYDRRIRIRPTRR